MLAVAGKRRRTPVRAVAEELVRTRRSQKNAAEYRARMRESSFKGRLVVI